MKSVFRCASLLLISVFAAIAANATPASVDVLNFSFSPQNVTINQGETVTWVWVAGLHSSTSDAMPPIWDSGVHFQGDTSYTREFSNTGTFPYHCSVHGVSMSGTVTVEAGKADTTTTLSSSQDPSTVGQSVILTAAVAVSGGGGGTPSGTVDFFDGITEICNDVDLVTQLAQCTTSALTAGSHPMTVVYSGDADFNGSTSPELIQNVAPAVPVISATATSAAEVALSWTAVSGATSYEVVRSSLNGPYNPLLSTSGTTANDMSLSADTTYLYRVRAVGGGVASPFSDMDAATTVIFTDADLGGVTVKGAHFDELRRAINAMRLSAGLSALTYTDNPLAPETPIKAVHITELRGALDSARSAIMLTAIMYTDPTVTAEDTIVKAAHSMELRAGTQ